MRPIPSTGRAWPELRAVDDLFSTVMRKHQIPGTTLIDPLMHKAVNSIKRYPAINLADEIQSVTKSPQSSQQNMEK